MWCQSVNVYCDNEWINTILLAMTDETQDGTSSMVDWGWF